MRRSGWHPLLELRIRQIGGWYLLEGLDAINGQRCQIMTQSAFEDCVPTFIRIDEPARVTCAVEQARVTGDGSVVVVKARGWFGVSDLEQARNVKATRSGAVDAMRRYAQSRSYRHFGRDNRISDVAQFIDIPAALYWFKMAGEQGSEEATLEHAYLFDLTDHDHAYRIWRQANVKAPPSSAPEAIRNSLAGSLAHAVCVRASQRVQALRDLLKEREESESDFMDDYYIDEMQLGEKYLKEVANRPHLPHLSAAIKAFLKRTRVPPFKA